MAYELHGELILNNDETNSLLDSFVHPNQEMLQRRNTLFEEIDRMGIRFGESIEFECPNITIDTNSECDNTVEHSYVIDIGVPQHKKTPIYTAGCTTIQYSTQEVDDGDFFDAISSKYKAQKNSSRDTNTGCVGLEAA